MELRIVTYNVQHCLNYHGGEIDYDAVADTIKRMDPDVIGLNEIRGVGAGEGYDNQTARLADRANYPYCYFARAIDFADGPYGNAILSRYPIISAQTVLIPDPEVHAYKGYYETRCVLKATLDVPGGLQVCVSHFGLNLDEKENAVRTALSLAEDSRFLLMGDFNATPEDPVLAPLKARLQETEAMLSGPRETYPSDAPRAKIDYIFASPDVDILSAEVLPFETSDHRPLMTHIRLG